MKRKRILYLIMMALMVVILAGCSKDSEEVNQDVELGNTNGNLRQGGEMAYEGDWMYYSLDGSIYKSKLDGSEKTILYTMGNEDEEAEIKYINVHGKWVYFSGKNSETGGLYKIKTDGSKIMRLVSDTDINEVYIIGDKIYYNRVYTLSCDGDGSDKERICTVRPTGEQFNISGDYMYWTEKDESDPIIYRWEYTVCRKKLDGTDEQVVVEDKVSDLLVEDEWMYYYSNSFGVGKARLDGTEQQGLNLLDEYWYVYEFNIKGEWIYYTTRRDEEKVSIYKIKTDGTERQKMFTVENEHDIGKIYVLGDWLYFYSDGVIRRIKNDGTEYSVIFDDRVNETQEESEQTVISDVGSEVLPSGNADMESNEETETVEPEETEVISTSKASLDEDDLTLNNTYETQFEDVMLVTYPKFAFDFPSSWDLTTNIDESGETAVVTSNRGVTVTYTHMSGFKRENLLSNGSTIMLRVEATKVGDSSFVPSYVQATDYSYLGNFVVAKLKVTGQLNMKSDSDFTDVDGTVCYAVIPESELGTHDSVRSQYCVEFGYDYSGIISLIAEAAPGESFSEAEEEAVIKMLESYRVVE